MIGKVVGGNGEITLYDNTLPDTSLRDLTRSIEYRRKLAGPQDCSGRVIDWEQQEGNESYVMLVDVYGCIEMSVVVFHGEEALAYFGRLGSSIDYFTEEDPNGTYESTQRKQIQDAALNSPLRTKIDRLPFRGLHLMRSRYTYMSLA